MKRTRRSTPIALSVLALLSVHAHADVIVVDDDGGPGVDFTQLADAIAAAADGDVVRIRAGQYGNFFVSGKGVSLVGDRGVILGGDSIVSDLAPDQVFSISSVENLSIWFDDCEGVVLLDGISTAQTCCSAPLIATHCSDVRVQRSRLLGASTSSNSIAPSVEIDDSHVQFSGCTLRGQAGRTEDSIQDGAPALLCSDSFVHLARTGVVGGAGAVSADCSYAGGQAGAAVGLVGIGSHVVIAGVPTTAVTGGDGGSSPNNQCDGMGESAIYGPASNTFLRASGATLAGGSSPTGVAAPAINFAGILEVTFVPDPTLELLGAPGPGNRFRLRISGPPFSTVSLRLGLTAYRVADSNSTIDQLTSEERKLAIGTLNASGTLLHTLVVPANLSLGTTLWVQAASVSPNLYTERTNSVALVLR